MANLPPNLVPPDHAVGVLRSLKLTTRTIEEQGGRHEGVESQVLAIGWRSTHERMYYLVFDHVHHDVFWVDPDYVESLTS